MSYCALDEVQDKNKEEQIFSSSETAVGVTKKRAPVHKSDSPTPTTSIPRLEACLL